MRRLKGEHTSINIAQVVLNVVTKYRIGSRIRYFILNNALRNNMAVDLILKTLYPKIIEKQRKRR
jgi:hypothetical protein